MGEIVYVDLFFLINFSMDFLCFFLTAKLLHRRLSVGRGVLGAILGGLYADIALFLTVGWLWALCIDAAICAIMCSIVFARKKELGAMPMYILVYIAISMTLGGIMTALFRLWNRSAIFSGIEQSEGDGISVWLFALLALASGGITLLGGRFFRSKNSRKEMRLRVSYHGKSVSLQALADSGNLLREPMSGRPCIVADLSAMESILPKEVSQAVKNKDPSLLSRMPERHAKRIRLVNANTAAGGGLLIAIRPDSIVIGESGNEHEVVAMIALTELYSGSEGNQALLPTQLLI